MNNTFQTQIDDSGRVTIPKEILSELHLAPGTILTIEKKDEKITLAPVPGEPELIEKDGLLIVRPKITGDIEEFVESR